MFGNMLPIPVMVNTCYDERGEAIRRAVEVWRRQTRLASVGSGGRTHVLIRADLGRRAWAT